MNETIRVLVNSKRKLKAMSIEEFEKGEVDMCQALEDIYTEGMETGISQGISQGIEQGVDKTLELTVKLMNLGRSEDIRKAATDVEYQKSLFAEFGL